MTDWPDLVTTALLGTNRRPTSGDAVGVLELAARHRALAKIGGAQPTVPEPARAPTQGPPVAPDTAVDLLTELLGRPDPVLVTLWLRCCVAAERTAAAIHWTPLARLAARSTAYDRGVLGRALGERGRWFLRQNPDWRRLAAEAAAAPGLPSATAPSANRPTSPVPIAEELAQQPDLIFDCADPWPAELVAATWQLVGQGIPAACTTSYATRIGVRLPPQLYPGLAEAAEYYLLAPDATPAQRRAVRHAFVAMEQAAWVAVRISAAFNSRNGRLDRVEIPHV